jgi:inosose dehydratase
MGGTGMLTAAQAREPRLLGQAYVFQQLAAREKKPLVETVPEIFATLAQAGYRAVELTDAFFAPDTRSATQAALERNRIGLRVVYTGLVLHEPEGAAKAHDTVAALVETVKPLGARAINTNPNPKPKGAAKTAGELARQAAALNQTGAAVKAQGLELLVHHHEPEMRDDAREWRHILQNTDPALVSLCIDVDWVSQGGQDPVKLLAEAGSRVASLHLRNAQDKVWLEAVGPGDVDYAAVARQLDRSRLRPWLVAELAFAAKTAVTRPIGDNLKLSREFIEKTFRVRA